MHALIGLDIGGTKTAVVEATSEGAVLQRREIPTLPEQPFSLRFPVLIDLIEATLSVAYEAGRQPTAISVSIGGPLEITTGFLINPPHLPGWHQVPLKRTLEEQFPTLPVFVEHDGNAGALAEFYFGWGDELPDLQQMVFLTFGTGLGAGIIVNGALLRGPSDTAGEVGHLRLAPDGPAGFGKAGSWEGFASGKGLVRLAHIRNPERWPVETPIRAVVSAMLANDPEALLVARMAGAWMGQGIALLVDMLNPEVIALGTLGVVLGDRILEEARRVVGQEALPQAARACRIEPARLGTKIGDVASVMAALTHPQSPCFTKRIAPHGH